MSNVHGGAIGQSYFRSLIRLVYIIDPCYTVIRKSNTRKVLVIFSKPCDKVIKWWEIFQTFVKKICWKTNFIIFQLNFSIFSFEIIFSKWSKNLEKNLNEEFFLWFFAILQREPLRILRFFTQTGRQPKLPILCFEFWLSSRLGKKNGEF